MRYLKIIAILCICNLNAYSQDEFIDRYNNRISDFKLKIQSVTTDSLIYKAFGKIEQVSLKEIYCYRYKNGYWIYPDTTLKGKVIKGEFKEGDFSKGDLVPDTLYYKKPEYILQAYYFGTSTKLIDLRQDYKIEFTKDSLKTKVLKKNREVSFSLVSDTLNALFMCDVYKIIEDTIIMSGDFGGGNTKYWKMPIDAISYIDFHTDGQIALRITSSVIFSATAVVLASMGGGLWAEAVPGISLRKRYNLKSNTNYKFIKIEN